MTAGDWRPLLAGVHRRDGADILVVSATREIRVAGDPDVAEHVVSRCDGRSTAAEIAASCAPQDRDDARELLAALRANGVVVDCTEAWRILEEQASVGSPFFPEPGDDELAALTATRWRPAAAGPPLALEPAPTALAALAGRRASTGAGAAPHDVTYAELSALLAAAYAAPTAQARAPIASGGALYPLIVHVLVRRALGPLAPGVWWYDRDGAALRCLRDARPATAALLLSHELSDGILAREQPVLVFSADIARGSGKYGSRAHRYALMEVGAALQNATLAATELSVPLRPIGGLDEVRADLLLGLGGVQPLLAVLLGS